jgi:hypothetical protein
VVAAVATTTMAMSNEMIAAGGKYVGPQVNTEKNQNINCH